MSLSPTQRTLRELRNQGRLVDVCERWIVNPRHPGGGFRKDLFGFVDLIVLDPVDGIVGIQSCGQAFKAHLDKLLDSDVSEYVVEWLKCDGKLELWGWRKVKRKNKDGSWSKAKFWEPRVKEITIADFS